MRKHISTIIAVLIFITGLSLLLYPTVSECWNSLYQSKVVANYSDKMKKMTQKQKQAAIDAAVAYNKTLVLNDARFTPTEEQSATYNSLLDADGLGMMGYMSDLARLHKQAELLQETVTGALKIDQSATNQKVAGSNPSGHAS